MRKPCAAAIAGALIAAAAAAADYTAAIAELRGFLRTEMERLSIPCLSIALVDGGDIVWEEAFGFQDRDAGVRATPATVYRVGSISKLFAAVAVMQLAERGVLDIEAPITAYAPELVFKNPFNPEVPITLRHLMAHRAGILRESPVGSYFDPTEPGIGPTVRSFLGSELVHPVGAAEKYSNLGPTLAGYIIEKVAGASFAEHVEKSVLAPAGMASSSFLPDTPAVRANLVKAFMVDFDGTFFPAPTFVLGTLPAGNLYSTAGDLARFMTALLRGGEAPGGRLLSKASLDRMWRVQFPGRGPAGFGLGFFVNRMHDRTTISHSGAVYGFASAFVAMPEEKLGVVVLNNVDCANGFNDKVVRTALGAMLAAGRGVATPPLPRVIDIAPEALGAYEGKYRAPGREAWVRAAGRELRMRILGAEQILRPIAPDTFLSDGRLGYGTTYAFSRTGAGAVAGFTAGGVSYAAAPASATAGATPPEWSAFAGKYGWPHNVMKLYVKDGRLTCLVEWFFEYPLAPAGRNRFTFPDFGLYEGEAIEFVEDAAGAITAARMGTVTFPRLP